MQGPDALLLDDGARQGLSECLLEHFYFILFLASFVGWIRNVTDCAETGRV